MAAAAIVLMMFLVFCAIVVVVGGILWVRAQKKKKGTQSSGTNDSPGPSNNTGNTGNTVNTGSSGCSGAWMKGGVLTYFDVMDPKDGNGRVAGLPFKPKPQFYKDVNVVSVIDRDWNAHKMKDVEIRFKTDGINANPFVASVLDFCSDKDCGSGDSVGCCTRNLSLAKQFAGVEKNNAALFDVEQQTLQRVLGSAYSVAQDKGVMNVEYRFCNRRHSADEYSKYK